MTRSLILVNKVCLKSSLESTRSLILVDKMCLKPYIRSTCGNQSVANRFMNESRGWGGDGDSFVNFGRLVR